MDRRGLKHQKLLQYLLPCKFGITFYTLRDSSVIFSHEGTASDLICFYRFIEAFYLGL